jgi:hypothetical protein
MDIGTRIDAVYELRAERLKLQRQVDEIKLKETLEKESIREELGTMGLAKASGSLCTAGLTCKTVGIVENWDQVYDFIKDTDAFDLMQRRLSNDAWKARLDSGILIPGTYANEQWDLSLTKSSR